MNNPAQYHGRTEPRSADELDSAAVLDVLRHGAIEPYGRLNWSSNYALLSTVELEERSLVALYKPERGERALWDFPAGLWRREVAAYELANVVGWELVPPTVARPDGPLGAGSLQLWLDCDYDRSYFTEIEQPAAASWLRELALFDLVINNADRKGGHVLVTTSGERRAIDHGLCFHSDDKLRTVMWDFVGEVMPPAAVNALAGAEAAITAALEEWLVPAEVEATRRRLGRLLDNPTFPAPFTDPPYPWPLL